MIFSVIWLSTLSIYIFPDGIRLVSQRPLWHEVPLTVGEISTVIVGQRSIELNQRMVDLLSSLDPQMPCFGCINTSYPQLRRLLGLWLTLAGHIDYSPFSPQFRPVHSTGLFWKRVVKCDCNPTMELIGKATWSANWISSYYTLKTLHNQIIIFVSCLLIFQD